MSFKSTSQRIRLLDDHHSLSANCRRKDGTHHPSVLSLDTILGNDDGHFRWGLQGFSSSARGAHLRGTVLHADLLCNDGVTWKHTKIDLNDHVKNSDGVLEGTAIPVVVLTPALEKEPLYPSGESPKSGHHVVPVLDEHGHHLHGDVHAKGWHIRTHSDDARTSVMKIIKDAAHVIKRHASSDGSPRKSPPPYPSPNTPERSVILTPDDRVSVLDLKSPSGPVPGCQCSTCLAAVDRPISRAPSRLSHRSSGELASQEGSFESLDMQLKDADAKIVAGKEEIKSLQEQLAASTEAVQERNTSLSASTERIGFLSGEVASKEEKISELGAKIVAQHEDIRSLREQLAASTEAVLERDTSLGASTERIAFLSSEVASKEEKITELEKAKASTAASLVEFQQRVADAQDGIKALQAQFDSSVAIVQDRDASLTAANERIVFLLSNLTAKEETIVELENANTNISAALVEAQGRVTEANTTADKSKTEIASLKAEMATHMLECRSRDVVLAVSEDRVRSLIADSAEKEKTIAELNHSVTSLEAALRDSHRTAAAWQKTNTELETRLRRLTSGYTRSPTSGYRYYVTWCTKVVGTFFAVPIAFFGCALYMYRTIQHAVAARSA